MRFGKMQNKLRTRREFLRVFSSSFIGALYVVSTLKRTVAQELINTFNFAEEDKKRIPTISNLEERFKEEFCSINLEGEYLIKPHIHNIFDDLCTKINSGNFFFDYDVKPENIGFFKKFALNFAPIRLYFAKNDSKSEGGLYIITEIDIKYKKQNHDLGIKLTEKIDEEKNIYFLFDNKYFRVNSEHDTLEVVADNSLVKDPLSQLLDLMSSMDTVLVEGVNPKRILIEYVSHPTNLFYKRNAFNVRGFNSEITLSSLAITDLKIPKETGGDFILKNAECIFYRNLPVLVYIQTETNSAQAKIKI